MTVPLTDPERLIAQLEHIEKSPGDLWDQMTARRAREEISRLTIERDNLQAARDWAVDRLYPYVLERAGPKPVPLERIAGLAAERIDALARQQPSQFARLDELHTASARAGVSWGLHYHQPAAFAVNIIHTYPLNDLRDHVTDGVGCWCNPDAQEVEGGTVIVHNSMDGREALETGERKAS